MSNYIVTQASDPGQSSIVTNATVGIGITTPGYKLDVYGGDARILGSSYSGIGDMARLFLGDGHAGVAALWGAGLRLAVFDVNGGSGSLGNYSYDALAIAETTGYVGIGMTNPDLKLSVQDASIRTQAIFGQDRTSGQSQIAIGEQDTYDKAFIIGYDHDHNYGYMQVGGDDIGSALAIANGGSVGVGTTSPGIIDSQQLKLDVQGYAGFNGLRVGLDGSSDILADSSNGLTITSKNASAKMQFKTGGTAGANIRMTIDSSGNVGINQTSPGQKLDVNGNINISTGNSLKVNNTNVVGARKTGWSTATGTATRTTFATYAGQTISNPPTQAQVQTIDNHVKILSQRLKALIDDLHATAGHGLIGS